MEITISGADQVGKCRDNQKYPRDIIVKFPFWVFKTKILEACWGQPTLAISGSVISIFPDLCLVTLKNRRIFKFLRQDFQKWGLSYHWEFPFRHN